MWAPVAQRHNKRKGGGRGTQDEVRRVAVIPPKSPSTNRSKCGAKATGSAAIASARLHRRPLTLVFDYGLDLFIAMANNGDSGTSTGGMAPLINLPFSLSVTLSISPKLLSRLANYRANLRLVDP
jgi:hypothetical protein